MSLLVALFYIAGMIYFGENDYPASAVTGFFIAANIWIAVYYLKPEKVKA